MDGVLNRLPFLSTKKADSEALQQFWNAIDVIAVVSEFGAQFSSLANGNFLLTLRSEIFTEKMCSEAMHDKSTKRRNGF